MDTVKTRAVGVDFLRERADNGAEVLVVPQIADLGGAGKADVGQGNRNASGLAGVTNDCVGFLFRRHACTVVGRDEDDTEGAFLQHTGKLAGALANRQRLFGFIPGERNGRVGAFFVAVIVILIFVGRELAVRAG